DIVTLAKPLGGGLPLGAILTRDNLAGLLQAGMHGTTFGGNPVACAGGCVVLDELTKSKLLERVRERGEYFFDGLIQLQKRFPQKIREVRGKGLMLACELTFDGQALVSEMLRRNIIVNLMHGKILRFLPPYIVETAHIDECLVNLGEILSAHRENA
ncbi:MAG: aminotransferase class III-fold pyridoxal phosphate-dependent enzyme, partial [Bacteroidota bacterium]